MIALLFYAAICVGALIVGVIVASLIVAWFRRLDTGEHAASGTHTWPTFRAHVEAASLPPVTGPPVMPLPQPRVDHLREHIAAAWAATGITQAEFWRQMAPDAVDELLAKFVPPADLPGHDVRLTKRIAGVTSVPAVMVGEPTEGQRAGLWAEKDIRAALPARVIAALEGAQSDETASGFSRLTPHGVLRYTEQLAGGDPFDGLGSVDAYIEKLFGTPRRVRVA